MSSNIHFIMFTDLKTVIIMIINVNISSNDLYHFCINYTDDRSWFGKTFINIILCGMGRCCYKFCNKKHQKSGVRFNLQLIITSQT